MTQTSFRETTRSGRDLSLSSYYRQQKEHNQTGRSNSGTYSRRVIVNNVRGKPVDKITELQKRPVADDCVSIYQQDYEPKQGGRPLRTSQGFREKSKSIHKELSSPIQIETNMPETPLKTYHERLNTASATSREYGLRASAENFQSPDQILRTPQTTTHRSSEPASGTKKKMMHATQWEPFFSIPKKDNKLMTSYKNLGRTLYQRDYNEYPIDEKGWTMTNDFYTTQQKKDSVDYRTTSKSDYKNWNMGAPKREGEKRNQQYEMPFESRSNYRTQFINWGGSQSATFEKPAQQLNLVKDLPFLNRTTYKDNYGKQGKEEDDAQSTMTKLRQEKVFTQTIPFLGETNYQKTFRPFRVSGNAKSNKKEAVYQSAESYQGLYRTTFGTDFTHPKERIYWPGENDQEDEHLADTYSHTTRTKQSQ